MDDAEKKSTVLEGDASDNVEDNQKEDETVQLNPKESKKIFLAQPYKCGECKARYRSKVALLRHAVKHSGT